MHISARPLRDPQRARVLAVPLLLRVGVHVLVGGLIAWTMVDTLVAPSTSRAAVLSLAAVLAVVYAVGPLLPGVAGTVTGSVWWLAALLSVWAALLALTPDATYLAFPWFFLMLHLLSWRSGLVAVLVATVVAIAGFAWHRGSLDAGSVIGPTLGALVVVATVWGYTTVSAESNRRRELIGELHRTRADLAAAERAAGAAGERERLAREIHDTLAQGLSSIQLLLVAAARALPDGDTTDSASRLTTARHRIEQARLAAQDNLAEARRFVAELTPPALSGHTLAAALERLCNTVAGQSSVAVRFVAATGTDPATDAATGRTGAGGLLPTSVEVALLRIAQSALANVTQHAEATSATVTLTLDDTCVMLDIVDNGTGFDPSSAAADPPSRTGGFGLSAMRARVRELGGSVSIESEPRRGTAIGVTIPLAGVRP